MPYMIHNGVLYHSDELYHYGVKGMKWGRRKARDNDPVHQKKQAYKQAKKDYDKAWNDASGTVNRLRAISPIKKHRQEANARWDNAVVKGKAANAAKKEYKQAKKDRKANMTPAEKRKRALKRGAVVAGTALAAYGVYKVSKMAANKKAVNNGMNAVKKSTKSFYEASAAERREMQKQAVEYAQRRGFEASGNSNLDLMKMMTYLLDD